MNQKDLINKLEELLDDISKEDLSDEEIRIIDKVIKKANMELEYDEDI